MSPERSAEIGRALMILLAVALLPAWVGAKTWTTGGAARLTRGDLDGVSVLSTGEVVLAPETEKAEGLEAGFVWDLKLGEDGAAYLAAGSPGGVYRWDGGQFEVLYTAEQKHVTSVLPLPDGAVLAGVAPDGLILLIDRHGDVETLVDLEDAYVWEMVLGPDHHVYCATGPEGRILELRLNGEWKELVKTPQRHFLCLAVDREGRLYAGSSPDGWVCLIEDDGECEILYDADEGEVRDIALGPDGAVYACTAAGGGSSGGGNGSAPAGPAPPMEAVTLQGAPASQNSIYRIVRGEGAYLLLRLPQVFILSLAVTNDGSLLAGTGPGGRVVQVRPDMVQAVLTEFDAAHVTAVAADPDGGALASTANAGALWRIKEGYQKEGHYRSEPFDAGYLSHWGRLWWKRQVGVGQNVRLRVRTGNSAKPDDYWSEWSDWLTDAAGSQVEPGLGRFAQFDAELTTHPGTGTPALVEVNYSYRQANRRPQIQDVVVNGTSLLDGGQNGRQPAPARRRRNGREPAMVTIEWKAADANDDELAFDLYYRALDETEWKPLEEDIREQSGLQWDTYRVPDGRYLLKLVARDDVGRPPHESLSHEVVTPSVLIDNGPPRVTDLQHRRLPDGSYRITGVARDRAGLLSRVEVSRNSGDWEAVFPEDGIFDSGEEPFAHATEPLEPGEHVFVFAASDGEGNTGSARLVLQVPGDE